MNGLPQRIEITIAVTGEATAQTTGFSGHACRKASQFIEAALGRTTSERLTAEFHQSHVEQQQNLSQEGNSSRNI